MGFADMCSFGTRLIVTSFAVYAMLEFVSLSSIRTTSGVVLVGLAVLIAFSTFFVLNKHKIGAQRCPTCNGINYVPQQLSLMVDGIGEKIEKVATQAAKSAKKIATPA